MKVPVKDFVGTLSTTLVLPKRYDSLRSDPLYQELVGRRDDLRQKSPQNLTFAFLSALDNLIFFDRFTKPFTKRWVGHWLFYFVVSLYRWHRGYRRISKADCTAISELALYDAIVREIKLRDLSGRMDGVTVEVRELVGPSP